MLEVNPLEFADVSPRGESEMNIVFLLYRISEK